MSAADEDVVCTLVAKANVYLAEARTTMKDVIKDPYTTPAQLLAISKLSDEVIGCSHAIKIDSLREIGLLIKAGQIATTQATQRTRRNAPKLRMPPDTRPA